MAGDNGYIVVDLNARSDDGQEKQVGFHWYAGKPDEVIQSSKGHWFISLEAFELLVEWVQQKYPPRALMEVQVELENLRARLKSEAGRQAEQLARTKTEHQIVRDVQAETYTDAYRGVINQLIAALRAEVARIAELRAEAARDD